MFKKYVPKNLNFLKSLKNFNTTTPATAQPPQKSKEELKVEKLMEQWPEFIRNPDPELIDIQDVKKKFEITYKYHQGDKPNVRAFDQYNKLYQEKSHEFIGALTTDNIIEKFQQHEGYVTIDILFNKLDYICSTHKELTPEFYSYLIPLVKKHIATSDRHCSNYLATACKSAALINLVDNEFWNLLVYIINTGI
jgi:hypothetical protein